MAWTNSFSALSFNRNLQISRIGDSAYLLCMFVDAFVHFLVLCRHVCVCVCVCVYCAQHFFLYVINTNCSTDNWFIWNHWPILDHSMRSFTLPTYIVLTQVAVITASCCIGHICMVGGGGGYSCMLLLHTIPTSADASPNLALVSLPLHLTSWPLELVLVVFSFFQLVQTFHLHRSRLPPVATCAGGASLLSY